MSSTCEQVNVQSFEFKSTKSNAPSFQVRYFCAKDFREPGQVDVSYEMENTEIPFRTSIISTSSKTSWESLRDSSERLPAVEDKEFPLLRSHLTAYFSSLLWLAAV